MFAAGPVATAVTLAVAEPVTLAITALRGGAPAAWTPAELTDLALWLDAADSSTITLNGSTVSQWDDKSGNNNNASQATATLQPSLSGNDIIFDGADDGFNLTSQVLGEMYIYTVARGSGYLFSDVDDRIIYTNSDLIYWASETGGILSGLTVSGYDDAQSQITEEFYNNVDTATTALNGQDSLTGTFQSDFSISRIGLKWDDPTGISTWNGAINEIVIATDNADRQKLEGYLAWKWGLAENLPNDHPYRVDGRLFGFGSYKALSPSDSDLLVTSDGDMFIVQ